jgi:ribosomal-protein-alanine N-acetyltransferase
MGLGNHEKQLFLFSTYTMTKKGPKIETERLLLRPFELFDGPQVKEFAGDKAIADTTLNIPHPYVHGMAEEWISTHQHKFEEGELANYAIILRATQKLIGGVGLTINRRFNRGELDYLVAKGYWNQGYCTEDAKTILEYGFHEL